MASDISPINITEWIDDNKANFLPPVCNKLMHGKGQLKIMFVGGPNQRRDYHIEEGEELFYQFKGDMVLKIVEKGQHKDIVIREGELFRLPSRIPHSPQRYADTVGLVIERERYTEEFDGLRYYVGESTDSLWEKWFYCSDLGIQLGPLIKEYFASEAHKLGHPPPGTIFPPPPLTVDTVTATVHPRSLSELLAAGNDVITGGEFAVKLLGDGANGCPEKDREMFLWCVSGSGSIQMNGATSPLSLNSSVLVLPSCKFSLSSKDGTFAVLGISMDPNANK